MCKKARERCTPFRQLQLTTLPLRSGRRRRGTCCWSCESFVRRGQTWPPVRSRSRRRTASARPALHPTQFRRSPPSSLPCLWRHRPALAGASDPSGCRTGGHLTQALRLSGRQDGSSQGYGGRSDLPSSLPLLRQRYRFFRVLCPGVCHGARAHTCCCTGIRRGRCVRPGHDGRSARHRTSRHR